MTPAAIGRQETEMTRHQPRQPLAPGRTAFLFDLDGTLVDSVYQHVLA
jgi:trehalose-6-phosphatase